MIFPIDNFVRESNRIEGITRNPTVKETDATEDFINLPVITVADVANLVSIYAPGHRLRNQYGLDVRVGDHIAPRGCPEIETSLEAILQKAMKGEDPWQVHIEYETLHPFTDGNGRSGRTLWLWQMQTAPIGFLHQFYYQTLSGVRR